jgi:hypothetical protein
MPELVRRALIVSVFSLGTLATVATSAPAADISGVSGEFRVTLDADNPVEERTAVATIDVDAAVASGTGAIGLQVVVDDDAEGSLAISLTSSTTGASQSGDIVDTQAQGELRIGIDAFDGCGPGACDEELVLEFRRTDPELGGTLGLSFVLDGLASTDSDQPVDGSITFSVD